MPPLSRRQESRLAQALMAVKNDEPVRATALKFKVKLSTLYKYKKRGEIRRERVGRRPMLHPTTEEVLVKMLLRHAQQGIPLTQLHLIEAIRFMLRSMSPAQRRALKIVDVEKYSPSPSYLIAFRKRHRSVLKFGRPTPQEAKRFRAVNAEVLANHFATIEKIAIEYNLGPEHVFNLDECGISPDKDCAGRLAARRFIPTRQCKHERADYATAEFSYKHRVTVMPVVSAAGLAGPPLFVFSGNRLQYEVVEVNGKEVTRPVTHRLPRDACVATRESLGGVDTRNFLSWAHQFIRYSSYLREGGQKILLVFDGYRAHLSPPVLELFNDNGVIIYALPSHSSGTLQPLDCSIFSAFKSAMRSITADMVLLGDDRLLDQGDLCSILRAAYDRAFTQVNIQSGFRNAGLYPLNHHRVTCQRRPATHAFDAPILSVEELERKVNERRSELRTAVLGEDAKLCRSGYVDTSHGCVITSATALELVRSKDIADRARAEAKKNDQLRKELRVVKSAAAAKAEIGRLQNAQLHRRAAACNESVDVFLKRVRPLKERVALAKIRAQNRRS